MLIRLLLLVMLAAAPAVAWADPISLGLALLSYVGASVYIQVAFLAIASIYQSSNARRKRRRAEAEQRASYNASLQDRSVSVLQADPPWDVVYGRTVKGGSVIAILTSDKTGTREDGTTYTKPDALKHIVQEIAHHEVYAIHEVYIEGVAVGALDVNGWATSGEFTSVATESRQVLVPGSGYLDVPEPVVSILNAIYSDYDVVPTLSLGNTRITNPDPNSITVNYTVSIQRSHVRVSKLLGSDSQTVDAYLSSVCPAQWTSNHRMRGAAGVVVTVDLEEPRFQGGPPNITVDVSGRLMLDTRTAVTAWSDNPALCTRDWLMAPWGYSCAAADIDEAYCNASANACEVLIDLVVDGVVTAGQRKYTCNGAFSSDQAREAVLEDLCESMAGQAVYGAQWMIQAGAWTPAVTLPGGSDTLTDDDLDGQIEIVQAGSGDDEIFNGLRGTYIPAGKSVPVDMKPPYQNAVFVSADGEELWGDLALPFTNHAARARNIARIKTELARAGQVIRYPAKLKAWPLRCGDRIKVTNAEYGFSSKYFRVTDWQFGLASAVMLTLQEDAESIYDEADEAQSDATPNTNLPNPWSVAILSGVSAVSSGLAFVQGDGSISTRVRVSWNVVTDPYVVYPPGRIEVMWSGSGSATWHALPPMSGESTQAFIDGVREGERIVIRARAINGLGKAGGSTFISHTVFGKTAAADGVTGLGAVVVNGGVLVSWSDSTESDNAYTEVRHGAVSWATATTIFRGKANRFVWPSPSAGSYTLRAKHFDTSGNESATNATYGISFTSNDLRDAAAVNFDARNDRIATAVVNPTIAADGSAVDHAINTNGSADISFEWAWAGTEAQIDGFQVVVRISASSAAYTIGTTPAEEMVFTMPANKRAQFLYGINPTSFVTFGVRAYRIVDPDINAAGVLYSSMVQPSLAGEAPYRPAASVAFGGDVTGTVGSIPVANVNVWSEITGVSVTTDDLAANAATVVLSDFDETGSLTATSAVEVQATVVSVTWTNATTDTYDVEAAANVYGHLTGGTGTCYYNLECSTTAGDGSIHVTASLVATPAPFPLLQQFTLAPGETATAKITAKANMLSGGSTSNNWSSAIAKLTIIKR